MIEKRALFRDTCALAERCRRLSAGWIRHKEGIFMLSVILRVAAAVFAQQAAQRAAQQAAQQAARQAALRAAARGAGRVAMRLPKFPGRGF